MLQFEIKKSEQNKSEITNIVIEGQQIDQALKIIVKYKTHCHEYTLSKILETKNIWFGMGNLGNGRTNGTCLEPLTGDKYEGELLDGYYHGHGTYHSIEHETKLTGSFINGIPYGILVKILPDGMKCEELYFEEGFVGIYNGEREEQGIDSVTIQIPHGESTLSYHDGIEFIGSFENGHPHGFGKILYPSGHIEEGCFHYNSRNGQIITTTPDNQVLVGTYIDDICVTGGGVKIMKDKIYQGNFTKGKFHGYGELKYNNGWSYKGLWKEGKKPGKGTIISPNGKKEPVLYKHDVYQDRIGNLCSIS